MDIVYVMTAAPVSNEIRGLTLVFKQNADIKEQVMFNTRLLQELIKKQRSGDIQKAGKLPDNLKGYLPLKCRDDMVEVERLIKDHETYKQLVC